MGSRGRGRGNRGSKTSNIPSSSSASEKYPNPGEKRRRGRPRKQPVDPLAFLSSLVSPSSVSSTSSSVGEEFSLETAEIQQTEQHEDLSSIESTLLEPEPCSSQVKFRKERSATELLPSALDLPPEGILPEITLEEDSQPIYFEDRDESEDSSEEEWEDTLIYVDLDDIPSVQELFATRPDDFLLAQNKRQREKPQPKKPTHPELHLQFHNLDSQTPVLQVDKRYYTGRWQDSVGSAVFFRQKNLDSPEDPTTRNTNLFNMVPEMDPPPDPVFGEREEPPVCFEMVCNVQKVLKMTRREVDFPTRKRPKQKFKISTPKPSSTTQSDDTSSKNSDDATAAEENPKPTSITDPNSEQLEIQTISDKTARLTV